MRATQMENGWMDRRSLLTLCTGLVMLGTGCPTVPTAFIIEGPSQSTNEPPGLTIIEPNTNLTRDQGANFLIRWTDQDRDSSALISFSMINTTTNAIVPLIDNLEENDTTGPDQVTIGTGLLPIGTYNLFGTIDDGVNAPVTVFAVIDASGVQARATITIVPPGQGQQTIPPIVTVTEPAFNQSVAQDDILRVSVQPSALAPVANQTPAFDLDSNATLYIVLDLDSDPNNDDPANPEPDELILLRQQTIQQGAFDAIPFDIPIDLSQVPPRAGGQPYFIRATIDDQLNPRVHQYAVGTISVVELASGTVDLFQIGKTISGVRFYGFNPGANLGSSMSTIGNFDADGISDFVLVAQFGNPRNFGLVGEAYGIYGLDRIRFGGSIAVNSVADSVSGVIFEGPPVRQNLIPASDSHTDGISSVSFLPDVTGDNRNEILLGLRHVHGAVDSTDYDPGDTDADSTDTEVTVTVTIRQGEVQTTVGMDDPEVNLNYLGVDDTKLSTVQPGTSFGSSSEMSWQNSAQNGRQWALIKFKDVLSQLPDPPANINPSGIMARLQLRVFRTGGDGTLFQALTDFTEQTTYNTYAKGGGDPVGGDRTSADADYVIEQGGQGLGSVTGAESELVTIDISNLFSALIDGELLEGSNNELRFIIVPSATEGEAEASIRSGEFNIQADRPLLNISYTRRSAGGAFDCYRDDLVNNFTDQNNNEPQFDVNFYAGGMALIINSTNREIGALPNSGRLDSTSIALELVGQRTGLILDKSDIEQTGGGIFARADNSAADVLGNDSDQPGRIAGARVIPGGFDYVDARLLNQPPRSGLFGQDVASIGDLNNDGVDEIIISAPRNERAFEDLVNNFGFSGTHRQSTLFRGSIVVLPGTNYNLNLWRDKPDNDQGTSTNPFLDQNRFAPFGSCVSPFTPRHYFIPADSFSIFAENVDDMLGGASSAGDFNQDGIDDILCGAPTNNRSASLSRTGAAYVIYGRSVLGDFLLNRADDPLLRPPMLRIRGVSTGDQVGWRQARGLDVNGDRLDDVFLSSPTTDFGGVRRSTCARDFNGDGLVDESDLSAGSFNSCRNEFGSHVFTDDACKAFDYDNNELIDDADESVFQCLDSGGTNCCANLVDNGFVGVIFGGVFIDGDRTITQIGTSDLPGVTFYGSAAGHRAGTSLSSAGDFNQDGFGDLLITVPGEIRLDDAGRPRLGVVYLIFGGTHLTNAPPPGWNLAQVGSVDLPGIVFLSPFVQGRPNEAAPSTVALLGDINNDGFGDIGIGNPLADFIDLSFPQGPDATDASVGRRRDAGEVYVIYGNNFGDNRRLP